MKPYILCAAAASSLGWVAPSHAQSPEWSRCAPAVAAIRAAGAGREDFEVLAACPTSGAAAAAAAWLHHMPAKAETRDALVESSVRLRDRRLYDAVIVTARGIERSTDDRVAALVVLASYHDSALAVSAAVLRTPRGAEQLPRYATPLMTPPGAIALPEERSTTIPQLIATLAKSDGDPVVRASALRLRQSFALARPGETVLESGVVSLTAGCGERVTLRSRADVALPIVIRAGKSFQNARLLPAGSAAGPAQLLLGLPAGVVTVSVGDRIVARLTDRTALCAKGQPRE